MLDNFKKFTWKGDKNNNFILKDLTTSIKIYSEELSSRYSWKPYYIKDEDTLELISYKFYGSTDYWWIIMITNNIIDYVNDMPMKGEIFIKYCCEKNDIEYDTINHSHMFYLNKIKFYEKNGIITHIGDINDFTYNVKPDLSKKRFDEPLNKDDFCVYEKEEEIGELIDMTKIGTPVTILEYETRLNEEKRTIRILNQQYINDLLNDLYEVLNNE